MSLLIIYAVIGYRGTNGWPGMYQIFNPTSAATFEEQLHRVVAWFEDDTEHSAHQREVLRRHLAGELPETTTFFVYRGAGPCNLSFIPDMNAAVPAGFEEFPDYASLRAHMGWTT